MAVAMSVARAGATGGRVAQRAAPQAVKWCAPLARPGARYAAACHSLTIVKALEGDDAPPPMMSKEEAYDLLGLAPGAKFDEVVTAKNKKLGTIGDDMELKMQVEAAYDILLMQSMNARLSGESNVLPSVKYADVPPPKSAGQIASDIVKKLPGDVALNQFAQSDLTTTSAVFGGLAVWALIQACTESPTAAMADTASLQVAVALAASVYLLREKKSVGLGKAAGLTAVGLIVGCLVGAGVEGWLRVDIVPIGPFSSPGVLVSEFGLIGMWAACVFLA